MHGWVASCVWTFNFKRLQEKHFHSIKDFKYLHHNNDHQHLQNKNIMSVGFFVFC